MHDALKYMHPDLVICSFNVKVRRKLYKFDLSVYQKLKRESKVISKIGISGKAHAGKDTVAKLIIEQCAKWLRLNEINNYHFADPIKQHLCDILKCDPSMFNDSVLKESVYANNLTYRQLMQNTGDSFKNLLGEDIFVNLAASACMRHELSVIPDVRYINEANWVKSHGVIVQVIDVTGITTVHNTHSSETTEIVPDVILHNDKTKPIELLEEQIRINVLPFLFDERKTA